MRVTALEFLEVAAAMGYLSAVFDVLYVEPGFDCDAPWYEVIGPDATIYDAITEHYKRDCAEAGNGDADLGHNQFLAKQNRPAEAPPWKSDTRTMLIKKGVR